jgi:hypothetical protein
MSSAPESGDTTIDISLRRLHTGEWGVVIQMPFGFMAITDWRQVQDLSDVLGRAASDLRFAQITDG